MSNYQLYSAQTGSFFGQVQAASESDAVDKFAQARGHANRQAMWKAGSFEYVSAYVIRSKA